LALAVLAGVLALSTLVGAVAVALRADTPPAPISAPAPGPTDAGAATDPQPVRTTTTTQTRLPASSTTLGPATTVAPSTTAPAPPTTRPATPTTRAPAAAGLSGKVVVIDPGHQGGSLAGVEPIGPGSSTMKEKTASGTAGVVTGIPEAELTLAVSLKLREALRARGVTVYMTRETLAQTSNIGNVDRARFWNAKNAHLAIRVHADGAENRSARGIHVLYPSSQWTTAISAPSKRAAQLAQQALVAATGAPDRGIDARDDMTGFNWSQVPVILPEIGFMSNPEEDRLLATDAYRQKIANALADAAVAFLRG